MLSNAYFENYFLAKFCFDTAENEPAENLQNFRKSTFARTQRSVVEQHIFSIKQGDRERLQGDTLNACKSNYPSRWLKKLSVMKVE